MLNNQKISKFLTAALLSLATVSVANAQSSTDNHEAHFVKHICAFKNKITVAKGAWQTMSDADKAKIEACVPLATTALDSCKTKGLADGQRPTAEERAATAGCMERAGYTIPPHPAHKS